jgi:hypothetical protein
VHQHSVYDVLLWFLGFPIGFWACFKLAPLVAKAEASSSSFVGAAIYVYIFVVALFLFRALFHYFRWVFPIVEYKHERSRALAHRAVLSALSIGLVGAVIYDVVRTVAL